MKARLAQAIEDAGGRQLVGKGKAIALVDIVKEDLLTYGPYYPKKIENVFDYWSRLPELKYLEAISKLGVTSHSSQSRDSDSINTKNPTSGRGKTSRKVSAAKVSFELSEK